MQDLVTGDLQVRHERVARSGGECAIGIVASRIGLGRDGRFERRTRVEALGQINVAELIEPLAREGVAIRVATLLAASPP